MSNILEEYSLTEVARQLNVPDIWIRRWESYLNLMGSSGQQGKRSVYTSSFIAILRGIKILQTIGFNNSEIKRLWESEAWLKKLNKKTGSKGFRYTLYLISKKESLVLDEADFKKGTENYTILANHYALSQKIDDSEASMKNELERAFENTRNAEKDEPDSEKKKRGEILFRLGIRRGYRAI